MERYVPRKLGPTLLKALATFPAVVLTGARQTGKTTLLRHELGDAFRYRSLEDPDVRARFSSDPRGFLHESPPPCIFDEVQHSPEIFTYVKSRIDEDRRPGRWIFTGSQSFALMAGVTESLAGRAAVLHLHGLSMQEMPPSEVLPTRLELLRGSFPEPRLDPRMDLRLWMASYLQTYLERDLRQLAHVEDLTAFEQFARLCAARTGQTLRLAELARDGAISATTARRWTSLLETSGQILLLPPYARSATKRMVKSPRLYFLDTGLAAFLTGHRDEDVIWGGPMKGALFETAVLGEIIKAFHNAGDMPSVTWWRSSDGLEVDFVIEAGGLLHGIEAKATATALPRMADSLLAWRKLLGPRAGRTVLACDIDRREPVAPGVEAIPWSEIGTFCLGLFSG